MNAEHSLVDYWLKNIYTLFSDNRFITIVKLTKKTVIGRIKKPARNEQELELTDEDLSLIEDNQMENSDIFISSKIIKFW